MKASLPPEDRLIHSFARRSVTMVELFALAIALAPTLFGLLLGDGAPDSGVSWGVWVPFSFGTILAIYSLCRFIVRLQHRIETLEGRGPAA